MSNNDQSRRRNHFIKKGFQLNFSIRFLSLIIVEAVLLASLFWYLSINTLTTSYRGSRLVIENTPSFFFPSMLYPGLIVIGVVGIIGIIGLIFISHKIAGPLYRFEKSLKEVRDGDLTCRVKLRKRDQLSDLSETLNSFTSAIEERVSDMKLNVQEIKRNMTDIKACLSSGEKTDVSKLELPVEEALRRLNDLSETLDRFSTSRDNRKAGDVRDREA